MIQGKLLSYGDDLTEAFAIRKKVFVQEQGIPENLEFDESDNEAIHVVVYEEPSNPLSSQSVKNYNKKAVATGRIICYASNCQIGRIAVLKEYRGMKYGDFTVRMLLNKAFTAGIKEVFLNAQLCSEDFYKKVGFHRVGDTFLEAGIEHCKMIIGINDVRTQCKK